MQEGQKKLFNSNKSQEYAGFSMYSKKSYSKHFFSRAYWFKQTVHASVAQLERMVLLYLMTFCNITVLCLTKLVLNLLLLQLLSDDDFFFFFKEKYCKRKKIKYFNDGGKSLVLLPF